MTPKYKDFLTKELAAKLRTLPSNQVPNFGLMTAHHMVEHLIYTTKSLQKRRGEPEAELNKSQRYFRKFMDADCPFEHRPKEDATLNELRTESIEEAIKILEGAINQFYDLFQSNPNHKSYNLMTGEFNLAELELFNYQHGLWHLYQFGLIEKFAPVPITTQSIAIQYWSIKNDTDWRGGLFWQQNGFTFEEASFSEQKRNIARILIAH